MDLSERTKKLIADNFIQMVMELPVENIRINDLCERCGISRHTCYYHFRDKYEVARWLHYIEYRNALERHADADPIRRFAYALKETFIARRNYYQRLLQYNGQNSLVYHLVRDTVMVYDRELSRRIPPESFTPELEMLMYYHSYGTTMVVVEWVMGRSSLTAEQLSKLVRDSLPQQLRDVMFQDLPVRTIDPVATTWEEIIQDE